MKKRTLEICLFALIDKKAAMKQPVFTDEEFEEINSAITEVKNEIIKSMEVEND